MQSFGEFRLQLDPVALYRAGRPVRIQAQALRLLALLVSRRGRLVTYEEIRRHIWQDHVVDFSAGIHVRIRQIRKALGEDARAPRFIETVARHGYRFVAAARTGEAVSLEEVPGTHAHEPSRRRVPRRFAELLLLTAILGIASSAGKQGTSDAWGSGGQERYQVLATRLYDQARHLSGYEQRDRNVLAQALLRRALLMNPEHGPSHALIADLHARFGRGYFGDETGGEDQFVARHLALAEEFGADRSDLLVTRGRLQLYRDRQVVKAQETFRRAIDANPGNPWTWRLMGETLYLEGRFDEALEANARAGALSVDPAAVLWDRLAILYFAERFDELFELHGKLKGLQQTGAITVGVAMQLAGRDAEAFDFIVGSLRSRGIVIADEAKARSLIRAGARHAAYAWLLGEIARNTDPPVGDKALATFLILSGDEEGAAARLRSYLREFRSRDTGTHVDCLCALTLPLDPFFKRYGKSRELASVLEQFEMVAGAAPGPAPTPDSA
jgi:DNA-binding winged helix-turn-helix (wHTH) protein